MGLLHYFQDNANKKSPEILERCSRPVYLLPFMLLGSIYVGIDSANTLCCVDEDLDFSEVAPIFPILNFLYIFYIYIRPYYFSEVTISNILDYDYFFTLMNLIIWTVALALLTFVEGAIFNGLGLGIIGVWLGFSMAVADFADNWNLIPDFQTGGHGWFTYPIIQFSFGVLSIVYTISTLTDCYIFNSCDEGEDLAILFGAFSVVVLLWLLVFRKDNTGRTYVSVLLIGSWFLGVFLLTYDVPFFVDGEIVANFFLLTWAGLILSFIFLTVSQDFIGTRVILILTPPMIIFAVNVLGLLAAFLNFQTTCDAFLPEIVDQDIDVGNVTEAPTMSPIIGLPTISPTFAPTLSPVLVPTLSPLIEVTLSPSQSPTIAPSFSPTIFEFDRSDILNKDRCEIYSLVLLVVPILCLFIAAGSIGIAYKAGQADANSWIRLGCKVILGIWTVFIVFLTFPFSSPVSLISSGFMSIWVAFATLLFFAFFSDEYTSLDGGNFDELEDEVLRGKLGDRIANLQNIRPEIRYLIYIIFLGSFTHFLASCFACFNDDAFDIGQDDRCTPQEMFSIVIGSFSLILLLIMVLCFSERLENWIKIGLMLLWPGAAWIPIIVGPFDVLQGNGYLSTFVTTFAVMGYFIFE